MGAAVSYHRAVEEPEPPVKCAECGREVDERTAIVERWTYWSDGVGELHPYCPKCAAREFEHRLA